MMTRDCRQPSLQFTLAFAWIWAKRTQLAKPKVKQMGML